MTALTESPASGQRMAGALLLALLLHAVLLVAGSDSAASFSESGSPGPAEGAGAAAETLIDVWLQPQSSTAAAADVAAAIPVVAPVAEKPVAASTARAPQAVGGGGRGGYLAQVRARIELQRRTLNVEARGTAQVGFTVTVEGAVVDLKLERSAGHAELDAEALQLVQRAVPLPPPPRQTSLRLSVPVLFE